MRPTVAARVPPIVAGVGPVAARVPALVARVRPLVARARPDAARARRLGAGAGLAILVLTATACGSPAPTAAPATSASTETTSPGPTPSATEATDPALTPLPAETVTPPSPAGDVVQDPSLLGILPPDIDGNPVVLEEEGFAEAAAVPDFAANVETAAYGLVVGGDDLGSAVVARLNPGVYSEAFYRSWRDSYNEGACGQAGGVVGNAESVIAERTVHIGTCAEALRTYHTWIEERGVLISAFSIGDRRFGEQLMAGLRP